MFYSGPMLETLGGVHTPAVGTSNHLASIVYPEIAHIRRCVGIYARRFILSAVIINKSICTIGLI